MSTDRLEWARKHSGMTVDVSRSDRYHGPEKKGIVIGAQFGCIVAQIEHACDHKCDLLEHAPLWQIELTIPEIQAKQLCSMHLHSFYLYEIDLIGSGKPGKTTRSPWPHTCDRCNGPALHMMNLIDCKNRCSPDRRF